jgi:uncharacterized membrane protein YvbJ
MYCSNCGTPIEAGENFCRNCGQPAGSSVTNAKLSAPTLQYPRAGQTVRQHVAMPPDRAKQGFGAPQRSSKKTVRLLLVALLFILIAASVGYFLLRRSAPSKSNIVLRLHGSNTMGAEMIPTLVEEFFKH